MARFLVLWRLNPAAPWPTDPSKYLELEEKLWAGVDGLMKKGEFEEWGTFPDVHDGYVIGKGETVDIYRDMCMFYPYVVCEVHEIISLEKHKEIIRAVLKAQIAALKK